MAVTSKYRIGKSTLFGRTKHWKKRGYEVLRSGSQFSFVAVRNDSPPIFVLLKEVRSQEIAKTVMKSFLDKPPFPSSGWFKQVLEVQVKGSSEVLSVEI